MQSHGMTTLFDLYCFYIGERDVPLMCSTTGHYSLPLTGNKI